jgi:hypothetical protein
MELAPLVIILIVKHPHLLVEDLKISGKLE